MSGVQSGWGISSLVLGQQGGALVDAYVRASGVVVRLAALGCAWVYWTVRQRGWASRASWAVKGSERVVRVQSRPAQHLDDGCLGYLSCVFEIYVTVQRWKTRDEYLVFEESQRGESVSPLES